MMETTYSHKIMFAVLIGVLLVASTGMGQCPDKCHCSDYKTFCRLSRLHTLPSGLPISTELLKMELDHIVELNNSVVSNSGLSGLECLVLTRVGLRKIQPGTFQTMNLLQSITITGNNITVLKPNTFKFLDNLYFLNLSHNGIVLLNSGSLSGLVNVRHLDLSWNNIKHLEANVFQDMKNSSNCGVITTQAKLDLFYNTNLQSIDFGVFQYLCLFTHFHLRFGSYDGHHFRNGEFLGLTRATKLEIDHIPFSNLSNIFNGLSGLLQLEITQGEIQEIETGAFENLKDLKHLNLKQNRISKIESDTFKGLKSLKVLALDYNPISTLSNNVFQHLESLVTLNMSPCDIFTIEPGAFSGLNKLQNLYLARNYIISLRNNTFSNLTMLRKLNLSSNPIKIIETGAFAEPWSIKIFSHNLLDRMQNMTYIGLNYEIRKLEVMVGNQATLVSNVELTVLLNSVQDIEMLKSMRLQMNATSTNLHQQLSDILLNVTQLDLTLVVMNSTETLAALSPLKLQIKTNKSLVFKSNSFISLPELEELEILESNGLEIQRNAFQHLNSLRTLVITHNKNIEIESGSFMGLHSLKHLDISNNQINELLKGSFLGLHNLENVKFSKNHLNTLNIGCFQDFDNINTINLYDNNLKQINAGVFGAVCEKEFVLSCRNASALSPYCNATNALKTLQLLNLYRNNIAHIHPHAFIGCTNLRLLNIGGNTMLTLHNSFLFTPALTNLYMFGCNNSYIPDDSFECSPLLTDIELYMYNSSFNVTPLLILRQLKYIDLQFSFIPFDCALSQTWYWLHERHVHIIIHGYSIIYGSIFHDSIYYDSDDITDNKIQSAISSLTCNSTLLYDEQVRNTSTSTDDFLLFKQYIEPIVLIIILISGLATNGFLLFISLRHSDMRTKQNACIIHLATVDLLSLVLNLFLSYWDVVHVTWELGDTMCKIFILAKDMMMGASVLSIVALSLERYLVARTFNSLKNICDISEHVPTAWFILMTWISSIVLSLPAYYSATVDRRCLYCPPGNEDYIKPVWTFQFIVYCLIPTVVITFLNVNTFIFMKKSISKMPGEVKNAYLTKNRTMIANMVLILAVVFFISYMPNFILRLLVAWSVLDIKNVFLISFFSFCLFFCNTICNPISLFIMSQKFKTRALKYFPCLTDQQNDKHNIHTFTTLIARNTKQREEGNLMRLQGCFTGIYNRISKNAHVSDSTAELELVQRESSCDTYSVYNPAVQARMERLANLKERFTGRSNRPTTSVPKTEIQVQESNVQTGVSPDEREEFVKSVQAARMERLANLQERFTGRSNRPTTSVPETEIQVQESNVQTGVSPNEREEFVKSVQAARMERLAKLLERFTGRSNRPTTSVPETEIQVQESNVQTGVSPNEREEFVKSVQAARMERLAKLQERFTGRSNRSQL